MITAREGRMPVLRCGADLIARRLRIFSLEINRHGARVLAVRPGRRLRQLGLGATPASTVLCLKRLGVQVRVVGGGRIEVDEARAVVTNELKVRVAKLLVFGVRLAAGDPIQAILHANASGRQQDGMGSEIGGTGRARQ